MAHTDNERGVEDDYKSFVKTFIYQEMNKAGIYSAHQ